MNHVLKNNIEFKETRTGVAQTKIENDIIAEVQDGGIEKPTTLMVYKKDTTLVFKFEGGWLNNWNLKDK